MDQIITTHVPMFQNWVPKIVSPGAQWCNIRAEESHRWSPASSTEKQRSRGMLQLGVTPASYNLIFSEIQQCLAKTIMIFVL